MITVTIVKECGATTVRARVVAPSIKRALELAGEGSKVEFPIDSASFFALNGSPISIEDLSIEDVGVEATAAAAPACSPPAKALPRELHPCERLLEVGPEALSGSELLAILLGGEAGRSLGLAGDVISAAGGLAGLRAASYHDLLGGSSITGAKACVVVAAVELGKRMASARGPERPAISSPADVSTLLGRRLRDLDRERFVAVLLDTKNKVIGHPTVSIGTLSSSLVHPREVFKPAIKASAASIILVHNHPSGSVEPSREDREVTKRLVEVGKHVGIEILDHVIIGDGYASLKERALIQLWILVLRSTASGCRRSSGSCTLTGALRVFCTGRGLTTRASSPATRRSART